ncbi:Ribosomal protein L11 methyltransferase PrmA [Aureococcus anophagefferens]|nr:Ribosomal protein L11 methyltransferase PrmA [Aureococcus anophagefferens]
MPTPIELKLSETCAITVFTESGAETGADDPTSREVWPAGYAAAMELLAIADERGGSLEGLAVTELGCGSGVASLAASRLGAAVHAADVEATALQLLELGAEASGSRVRAHVLDATDGDALDAFFARTAPDLVVVADLLYDQTIAAKLGEALARHCPPLPLLLVDPGRTHGRRRFLETFSPDDFFAYVFEPVPAARQSPTFRGEPAPPSASLGRLGPIAATRQDALPAEFPAVDAAEVGANRAYDWASRAQLRGGCVGDGGNATRWAAIVARAAANKRALARGARDVAPVRVLVLGGSVTLGTHCDFDPGSPPRAACAFPQRLATHLDAAYGPGAVEVVVRAMSGTGSGPASKTRRIIDAAATTDLLILDYAINDAVVATAKTYDVDDVAGLPEAKAVRQSTEVLLRVFTEAGAHVAVLCTFYVPLSPASWTHWLKPDARGHAASDGSPTFTFVACATEDELRRANRLHYAYQDIVAPVARRYGASLVSYRDAFWPDVAAPPHVAYWYNTRAEHETCGRYGGPFRQDPHPTYEDHQLIADVLWYHWLQHAAAAHCARDDDGADGPGEPEPEPELSPEEAAPADPCGAVLASFVAEGSDAEFPAARRGRDWRYYEDRPAKPGWIGQARERSQRRELGPVSASRGGDEFRERPRRRRAGAAPAVDVDDGAVTLVDAKWDRGESTYETIDVPAPAARCGAGAARDAELRCCPATHRASSSSSSSASRPAPGS